jgi:energy-coupling factor transporter ATP-binding protein EcfA2
MSQDSSISYFARTNFRNDQRRFGIKQADRLSHIHVIGKTGTGKSTLLETLVRQDIEAGRGLALIDPHGDLVERVAAAIPNRRLADLAYLNAPDLSQPFGYNPLKHVHPDRIPLAASGLLEVFKKMWPDAWGVRMEHVLRNALYALLERKDATLPDVLRLLSDSAYRKAVARDLRNDPVRRFWLEEFKGYSHRFRADSIAPIQNKVGAFLADPNMRRILTSPEQPISLRTIMDEGRILLVNLAKGAIGEDSSALLGGLLVTTVGLAAYSRSNVPEGARRPFYLYVDEFQTFTTLAVANMLSELRKYKVGATLAHQYLYQLEPDVRHAVLGNAGTLISFRLGAEDAPIVARELTGRFEAVDLVKLANYEIYLRLMIDGEPSEPFSATTIKAASLGASH